MIVSYEVGAIFRIINEASPTLVRILRQVRELNAAIEKARESLALVAKPASMGTAIAETGDLAKAWGDVAKNAADARLAIDRAAKASGRAAISAPAIAANAAAATGGYGGGGGRHRPSWLGGGAAGASGRHPHLGTPAMVAAFGIGAAVHQASEVEWYADQLAYHSHTDRKDPTNLARFRQMLQDEQVRDGFNIKEVGEAALKAVRMFQGTPGGGLDAIPEMLHSAAVEARSKGSRLDESMTAQLGIAHMLRSYDAKSIMKWMPTFAAVSTADPRSLASIERAAGYAVPTLQALDIDPKETLLLGTALATSGVTNTKAGTWLREAVSRAMPGTVLMGARANRRHREALQAFGLADEKGRPTWFGDDGKPDPLKMFGIAGDALRNMPVDQRAGNLRAAFGAQGSGAVGILGDDQVMARVRALRKISESPEFQGQYANYSKNLQEGSTIQNFRVSLQELNVTMGELARITLPSINIALGGFKGVLEGIRNVLPGGDGRSAAVVGGHGLMGAGAGAMAGAVIGAAGGPVGAVGGAVIGGALGVAEAYLKNQSETHAAELKKSTLENAERLERHLQNRVRELGLGSKYGGPRSDAVPQIKLDLNIDGRALASAVSEGQARESTYQVTTPASDGSGFYGP